MEELLFVKDPLPMSTLGEFPLEGFYTGSKYDSCVYNWLKEQILSSLKKWSNGDLSKMVRFIGIYFHLLNQAELNEIILINESRDKVSEINSPKADGIASAVKYLKENSIICWSRQPQPPVAVAVAVAMAG